MLTSDRMLGPVPGPRPESVPSGVCRPDPIAQEAIVTDLQETVGAVKEEAAKGIPNNPRINQLRVPIFGFSRRQLALETEWLRERGYSR